MLWEPLATSQMSGRTSKPIVGEQLMRARVHGGWLVQNLSGGIAFVPDTQGEWDGTSGPVHDDELKPDW